MLTFVLWIAFGLLGAVAIYRQVRWRQGLRQSLWELTSSYDQLLERIDTVIRQLQEAVPTDTPFEPPKPFLSGINRVEEHFLLLELVPEHRVIDTVEQVREGLKRDLRAHVSEELEPEHLVEQENLKKLKQELKRYAEKLLRCNLFNAIPGKGWSSVYEDEIEIFTGTFERKIELKPAAGDVPMLFAQAVLLVIGDSKHLAPIQKELVAKLCSAINRRPLPTMLWADFVRARLDKPQVISRVLTLFWSNTLTLRNRIQRVMINKADDLPLTAGQPVLIWGYTGTTVAALSGLPLTLRQSLKILSPRQHLPNREHPDGDLLREELAKAGIPRESVEVVENEDALRRIQQGEPSLILMGCRVIGLRKTGQLEVVNSSGALRCAEMASHAKIPVIVVAGAYKCWPIRTYERYRPVISQDASHKRNDIVGGDLVTWIMTEEGLFTQEAFKEGYNERFTTGGIPTATLREWLKEKKKSPEELASEMNELAKELEAKEDGLQYLPEHFRDAQRFYKEELTANENFLRQNLGKYVAVVGKEVVDSDTEFHELAPRVRRKFGYGPIFMPQVTRGPRVEYLGPRLKGE